MLSKILTAVGLILTVFVIVVILQPSEFRITRSASINALPAAVFEPINDFHRWEEWSPWAKLDPNAKNVFEGAPSGNGAVFHWAGNHEVGEGRMTILESRPHDLIRIKLEFSKPFKATNATEFKLEPQEDQTLVTWTMSGKNNFIAKVMSLIMNCDKMVGGQFEKGLANLKTIVEK